MPNQKGFCKMKPLNSTVIACILIIVTLAAAFATSVFAVTYNLGVTVGQYVKYGNFVGEGPGFEQFNDFDWSKIEVTSVQGTVVTLLSTSQFKNGTATPGNGSSTVWDVQAGTMNGIPSTQGPIIAGNLNQGDPIPPPDTFSVNKTENRVYLGVSRSVNILNVTLSTENYNSTLTYVYDRASGLLLEQSSQTTQQAQPQPTTSAYSYSITETNLFGSTPSPTIPELSYSTVMILGILATTVILAVKFRNRKTPNKT